MTDIIHNNITAARQAEVAHFVRCHYGIRGTLALHRAAIGWDLLRAPINVALSPIFLTARLSGSLLSLAGARKPSAWLKSRQIFLVSDVSRLIQEELIAFTTRLGTMGIGPSAPVGTIRHDIASHTETRNAVADIATSLLVLIAGFLLFNRATPGIISLAGPLAEFRAHSTAVEEFLLGNRLGQAWYWAFPIELSPWQVIMTGLVLTVLASLVTTFAGIIADPIQLATGTHRRRLMQLLNRLDDIGAQPDTGLAREHIFARLGDLSDAAFSLWRVWR
ncbi:MAG: DUF6635 family protein [Paracoccus sp. (in: a-proteobacteria)]